MFTEIAAFRLSIEEHPQPSSQVCVLLSFYFFTRLVGDSTAPFNHQTSARAKRTPTQIQISTWLSLIVYELNGHWRVHRGALPAILITHSSSIIRFWTSWAGRIRAEIWGNSEDGIWFVKQSCIPSLFMQGMRACSVKSLCFLNVCLTSRSRAGRL